MGNKPSNIGLKCKICKKETDGEDKEKNNGLCAACYADQPLEKDKVTEEDVLKELEDIMEEAIAMCEQHRKVELEQWNQTEVIKEVVTFTRKRSTLTKPDQVDGIETHLDDSKHGNSHLLCRAFTRHLSQDPPSAADGLSLVHNKLLSKLSSTAQNNPDKSKRLCEMLHTVCQAAKLTQAQKWILTRALNEIWQNMLEKQYPETLLCLSSYLDRWSGNQRESTEEQIKMLIVLKMLLNKLPKLAEQHTNKTWIQAEKQCLNNILTELQIDETIRSKLLGIVGPKQWSGPETLMLLATLSQKESSLSDTRNLLLLMQRYRVPVTWKGMNGYTILEDLQREVKVTELSKRLEDQLVEDDTRQFKSIKRQDSTRKSARFLKSACQGLEAKVVKLKWIDTAIIVCALIVLSQIVANYFGLLFFGGVCVTYSILFFSAFAWSKNGSVEEKLQVSQQQVENIVDVCRTMQHLKGFSPTYSQMEILCDLMYSRKRRPWKFITLVSDDASLAAMVTALHAKRSGRVGVLQDVESHQMKDWHEFYQRLNISVGGTDMNRRQTFSQSRSTVIVGDMQSFVNDYMHHYPWVSEEDEEDQGLDPRHFISGGYLPVDSLKFNKLSDEATFLQTPLTTLLECAGENASQKVELISTFFFALRALANRTKTSNLKYAPDDKLSHVCETFGVDDIPRKRRNFLRLLEITLRCVRDRQRQCKNTEMDPPFDSRLYLMCFDLLMQSAREAYREGYLHDSLAILSNLVHRQLWDPVEALDLFSLLSQKLGTSGNFQKRISSALKQVNPIKFGVQPGPPPTLFTVVKSLHTMAINSVSSSFKDQSGRTVIEILTHHRPSSNIYEELRDNMQKDREKSLTEILKEMHQNHQIDGHTLDLIRTVVEYVTCKGMDQVDIPNANDLAGAEHSPETLKYMLLILCQVVKKTMCLKPRLTQMISWCLLVLSRTGKLLQLGTGEGKSCVVAMFAAYRAIVCSESVDILSSSPVLARRDAEQWLPFFKYFDITVDCNADKTSDEARKKCYESKVVYGTVECFAADCLRQDFEKKDIRPNRGFQCMIVDEVDSLLLDKGIQTTYLSQDMPALQHIDIVLVIIWSLVSAYEFTTNSEGANVIQGPPKHFHKALFDIVGNYEKISHIFELTKKETILKFCLSDSEFFENLKVVTQETMINFFHRAEKELPIHFSIYLRDDDGHLQLCPETNPGGVSLLILDEGFCCDLFFDRNMLYGIVEDGINSKLCFSAKGSPTSPNTSTDTCVQIPSFLEGLVKHKIGIWIHNAFKALEMQENDKYKVEGDFIYPVDAEHTGVVEKNKKWGDGLQQFLELKHQRKLSNMAVMTNFLSNVAFFKKYQDRIFGTTGTLGTKEEIEMLGKVYNGLQTCIIPSFKQSKLFETKAIVVDEELSWRETICSAVLKETRNTRYRAARAALVICETIKEAKTISEALKLKMDDSEKNSLIIYTDSDDESAITTKQLVSGQVIVTTNLAGRGTDFQVCDKVKKAGGLFVMLTFLARNSRVEQQAFGRTARQGSPGSSQLVLCTLHLDERVQFELQNYKGPDAAKVELAKRARDEISNLKAKQTLEHDVPVITERERLFVAYCKILDDADVEKDTQVSQMTISMLNEYWGIWYLMNSENMKEKKVEWLIQDLKGKILEAQKKLKEKNSPHSSIYHYIKFANKFLVQRDYENSSKLYDKAIDLDDSWASIAYYYRALCSYKQRNKKGPENLASIIADLKKAKESANLFIFQCQIMHCLLQQCEGRQNTDIDLFTSEHKPPVGNQDLNQEDRPVERDMDYKGNSLQAQMAARMNVWVFYLNNIEQVISDMNHFQSVEMKSTFSLMKSPSMEDHNAMYRLYQLGLEHVFGTSNSLRFRWEGLVMIGLGAAQMLTGIAIGEIGLNLLNLDGPLGVVTKQGYYDILTGITALTTGEFSFNTWRHDKVVSLCTDVLANVPTAALRKKIHTFFNIPQVECSMKNETKNMFGIISAKVQHLFDKPVLKEHQGKFVVREEDSLILTGVCEMVKDSIAKKSKKAMKQHFKQKPLQTLTKMFISMCCRPQFLPGKQLCWDKLKDIFTTLSRTALESKCNGKNQPQLLSKMARSLSNRIVQMPNQQQESVANAMRAEYEIQWQGSAPEDLIAIADTFAEEFTVLLEKLFRAKQQKTEEDLLQQYSKNKDILKKFKKELIEVVSQELSMALYDLLLVTLEYQHFQMLSKVVTGQVQGPIKGKRHQFKGQKKHVVRRRQLIRQNTKHVLLKLENCQGDKTTAL